MKKKLKKRAERAGWIAGDTSLSDLSIEELSQMCGLKIKEDKNLDD
jgi:hypothetical protein